MIYVTKNQLDQVEYLISQSIQGNHILFDHDTVRNIFWKTSSFELPVEDAYSVEHHIEKLILLPTLIEKRTYLERLDTDTYERVVRTYFNIVENSLFENARILH